MSNPHELEEAKKAARHWSVLTGGEIERIPVGLLNRTFIVRTSQENYVLQHLNAIFAPRVHEDIAAMTTHLVSKGMLTPQLVASDEGRHFAMVGNSCWRLQTYIDGQTYPFIASQQMAFEAGALVGRFHEALSDFQHKYHFSRPQAHDTKHHLTLLMKALETHRQHPLYEEVEPIAKELLNYAGRLSNLWLLPARHSHGDLKISNVLFDRSMQALCLIDLDTLGYLPWPIEMGDAFRSWCNPAPEDATQIEFREDLFVGALNGYKTHAGQLWSKGEREAIVPGIETIVLELTSRFLRDALEESYFAFDPARFSSRGMHNLMRAKGQWQLFLDVQNKRENLCLAVKNTFGF